MREHVVVAILMLASAASAEAQTLRNPPGTSTLGGPSGAPPHAEATPAAPKASANGSQAPAGGPTRPTLGSETPSQSGSPVVVNSAPGHPLGIGPNGGSGTVTGGGAPGVLNPAGSNGGAGPGALSGSRPNGGSATSGAKSAPMQVNGVRKID